MNVIELFMTWLTALFQWFLTTSIMASLLVIMILLIKWVFKKQLSLRIHYFLWIILLLRLILPFAPESSFSIFNIFALNVNPMPMSSDVESRSVSLHNAPGILTQDLPGESSKPVAGKDEVIHNPHATEPFPDFAAGHTWRASIWNYVAVLWILGITVLLIYMIRMNVLFKKKVVKNSKIVESSLSSILERCKITMGVKATIPLLITNAVSGPTLYGLFRPKLLLPKRTIETLRDDELEHIFLHELAHYRRKDIEFNALFICMLVIHWFNPVIWYAYCRMRQDQELACDGLALSHINQSNIASYGHTILRLVEMNSTMNRFTSIAHFSSNKTQLKKRILMIKYFDKKKYRWSLPGVLLIALLGGCVLTNANSSAEQTDIESEPPKSSIEIQEQTDKDDIHFVIDTKDEIPGSLTKETATIGNVHLGDTKQNVYGILGEPAKVSSDSNTGEDIWHYPKQAATVYFYKESPDFPVRGVSRILIEGKSNLKTDKELGVGDSLDHIKNAFTNINGTPDKNGVRTIWINGENRGSESANRYYPTMIFELSSNIVQKIELTNQGVNPGPYDQKPLSYNDLKIGDIQIGDTSDSLMERYGDPSKKTTVHGIGDPEWIFEKYGITVFLDPVWAIRVTNPFSGSTPRGIRIGSTEDEVKKAYPDSFPDSDFNRLVQNSTDGVYQLVFVLKNRAVSAIFLQKDLQLSKF
ncbi:M56 family metallopeptidase [Paenibacillus sp. MSJ-34]|uniref:M56 family metallopeptidase n=1 Tax=Paenibacillus sp. MSJ-34 TaxID=2841529 RepID=UPI001C117321|nr:M56 family metallopeptidase [Paenibacillus sp. MSJ-34]MBU5445583.1 M56 family metallopeptidase [Paenibacillus sp. MSJ-34]